ncbi:molybdopterin-guanine dinucleotide biosynthesis protein A [Mycolicibacterium rhodesiae JS60]|nr:molybdopterin-guanine dinucleotide biosynthesis protein A [Mycolicibacterium rhodesiae JS60]
MGRDKATLKHPDQDTTMVEYTVGVLRSRCAPVFVIAAPGQAFPELQAEVLRDEVRGVGPLLATGRGLRAAAAAGLERAFVSAVDMPFLTTDVIDELTAYRGVHIVLPWDGRDHYLAGIYRTDLADHIDTLVAAGERSMRALAETVVTQRVVIPAGPSLANVNSPDDLQQIAQ